MKPGSTGRISRTATDSRSPADLIVGTLRLLPQSLDRVHHVGALREERISDLLRPRQGRGHHVEYRRERQKWTLGSQGKRSRSRRSVTRRSGSGPRRPTRGIGNVRRKRARCALPGFRQRKCGGPRVHADRPRDVVAPVNLVSSMELNTQGEPAARRARERRRRACHPGSGNCRATLGLDRPVIGMVNYS